MSPVLTADPTHLGRLINHLASIPAIILGRRMDILGWNQLVAALLTDFTAIPPKQRNYVRLTFADPAMRNLFPNWEKVARECVAQLHMEVAHDPTDARLVELVGELSVKDPDFRGWWGDQQVATRRSGTKELRHPVVGDLTLDWYTLTLTGEPDQQLVSWTAREGTLSHQRLTRLALGTTGQR